MDPLSNGERLTLAEYLATPETNRRRELAWGVVREPAAPNWDHQAAIGRLFTRLDAHVARLKLGAVGVSPIDVVLDAGKPLVVQPDLVFITAARRGIIRNRIWGAPDLVVEVLSPDSRYYDSQRKRGWYAQYGVRELWLVDPPGRSITVCAFGEDSDIVEYKGTEVLRSRVLPRLQMRVSSVLN